ncbi:hypothetical protein Tco_0277121 [Tanacetum coccineum]
MLGAKKRVRSPTKKKKIWNLASDEKVLVTFNKLCQPIGDEGNELTNFLGTLVRMPQHIGIHYPEWRKVPKEKKDDVWSIIKEKFSFQSDHSEKDIKEWIMSDMSVHKRVVYSDVLYLWAIANFCSHFAISLLVCEWYIIGASQINALVDHNGCNRALFFRRSPHNIVFCKPGQESIT